MSYAKPMVTIELDEYNELLKPKEDFKKLTIDLNEAFGELVKTLATNYEELKAKGINNGIDTDNYVFFVHRFDGKAMWQYKKKEKKQ